MQDASCLRCCQLTTLIHLALGFRLPLWAMTYGQSSGLPPWEAPVMIAEKRQLFLFFSSWLRCLSLDMFHSLHGYDLPLHACLQICTV